MLLRIRTGWVLLVKLFFVTYGATEEIQEGGVILLERLCKLAHVREREGTGRREPLMAPKTKQTTCAGTKPLWALTGVEKK